MVERVRSTEQGQTAGTRVSEREEVERLRAEQRARSGRRRGRCHGAGERDMKRLVDRARGTEQGQTDAKTGEEWGGWVLRRRMRGGRRRKVGSFAVTRTPNL